jgi:hypothetical protein
VRVGWGWDASGRAFFEKGDSSRDQQLRIRTLFNCCVLSPLSPLRLCCTRISLLFATVAAMASLVHLERYQIERRLDTVRRLLRWSAPSHAWRIRADASPLGDLAAGEFVLFVSYLSCGLALPIGTVGGSRSRAPAPHTPLHPSGGHLRSPVRDVCGGGVVHFSLPPIFRAGEVREGQGPSRCVLLPNKGGFGRCLYLLPQRCEVGKLAGRMGDRQYRGQRSPYFRVTGRGSTGSNGELSRR